MVQTVVDNFDADISSQNGKVSTDSIAILMTQTVKMESPGDNSRETIKRLHHSEITGELDYSVEKDRYRVLRNQKCQLQKEREVYQP